MFLRPVTKMEKFIRTVDVPICLLDVFVDGNVATCKSCAPCPAKFGVTAELEDASLCGSCVRMLSF
jgi:hypothetical protein